MTNSPPPLLSPRAAMAVLVALVALAYANSFSGVFVMDDYHSIVANPTIRSLGWSALQPPGGSGFTVEARPVLNFSLALNYALSGTATWSYHALNLLIHAATTALGFALLRRVLVRAGVVHAVEIGFFAAACWALHPLQTESVTYVVQRTEALMGFFCVGALYCQWRGLVSVERSRWWLAGSVVLCALGMATKEVMISAPILAWLIDRAFFAGTFGEAWRRRRWYYVGLAATWLLLFALLAGHWDRGGTVGGDGGVAWWRYALTQARALVHYVKLGAWPHPLIFDYGSDFATLGEVWLQGLVVLTLVAATLIGLWRRAAWALLGGWFFFILAPTSSVVGGSRQMLAEHRMYLPLLSLVLGALLAGYAVLGPRAARWLGGAIALAFLGLTIRRNADYQSELALYADNFAKRPDNPYGLYNYGYALQQIGRTDDAITYYRAALARKPDFTAAYDDLANLLARLPGREAEARTCFEDFLRVKPQLAEVRNNFAVLLLRLPDGRAEAIRQLEIALQQKPQYPEAHFNLGSALAAEPERASDAIAHFEAAVQLKSDYAEAHHALGAMLARAPGRDADARRELETAVRLAPDFADAHNTLGFFLVQHAGAPGDAWPHFETVVQLRPESADAHFNAGLVLRLLDRREEAIAHFKAALKLRPDFPAAQAELQRLEP